MADEREESIRLRAYIIWKEEGCQDGQDLRHWLQAEREAASIDRQGNPPAIAEEKIPDVPAAA